MALFAVGLLSAVVRQDSTVQLLDRHPLEDIGDSESIGWVMLGVRLFDTKTLADAR